MTRKEYDEIKDSLTRLQSLLPTPSPNSLISDAAFGSQGANYRSLSLPTCPTAIGQHTNLTGTRSLADIGTGVRSRDIDYPPLSRGSGTQHQPSLSNHANAPPHAHPHQPSPSSPYNPMPIAPPTPFTLPSLLQTSSSTSLPLLLPPFASHSTLQCSAPRQPPHFQSDSDQPPLPSLAQRTPSHFIQSSLSNSHSSAGSFTSPPFAPQAAQDTAQVYEHQPDAWNQATSSVRLNASFPGDECHRDVAIEIDVDVDMNMDGSHSSGRGWNADGPTRPLSPRNDVRQGGDTSYEPPAPAPAPPAPPGAFDNYRPLGQHEHQLCGPPPLDATEAIAKAMAAQRGDFVGGYKIGPPLPTFTLSNLHLQSRQGQSDMTAGSRDNLPAPLSCAAPPVHPTTARAHPQLSLRSPHSSEADSPVHSLVPPRLPLEGRAAKEAEMKRTMRICLPRKEVCDHLVEHYVSLVFCSPSSRYTK